MFAAFNEYFPQNQLKSCIKKMVKKSFCVSFIPLKQRLADDISDVMIDKAQM